MRVDIIVVTVGVVELLAWCWSRAVFVPGGITAAAGCGCSRRSRDSISRLNAVPCSTVSSVSIKTRFVRVTAVGS